MTYVEVLQDKRREVLTDIDTLRAQASEISARLAAKEGQLRNLDDLLAIERDGVPDPSAVPEAVARASTPTSQRFTDAAAEMLNDRGSPIHYQELARLLSEKGVYVPGKDPAANLIAHMLRDPRFGRASGRGMYGLADWPSVRTGGASTTKRTPTKATSRSRRTAQHESRRARVNV